MSNLLRAAAWLRPILEETPSCGDEEDDRELVEDLAKQFDEVTATRDEQIRVLREALRTSVGTAMAQERADLVAWLYSEDARRYTEVGPLIAKAILEGRHVAATEPKEKP